jgi:hypothetical protein
VRQAIAQARQIAASKTGRHTISDWWNGTSIESSWQALHRASEQLVTVQPPAALRAMLPQQQNLLAPGGQAPNPAAPPDPFMVQRIMTARHVQSDAHHQQIRALRNLLYVFFTAAVAFDCALWAAGVTTGQVVGLGALAGTISVVFAIRTSTPAGPYNLLPVQSLLKVATGAATALMAAKVLDFASNVPASTARDSVYAIVFGFSQQAFTRLIDQRADSLAQGTDARPGHPTTSAPSLAD